MKLPNESFSICCILLCSRLTPFESSHLTKEKKLLIEAGFTDQTFHSTVDSSIWQEVVRQHDGSRAEDNSQIIGREFKSCRVLSCFSYFSIFSLVIIQIRPGYGTLLNFLKNMLSCAVRCKTSLTCTLSAKGVVSVKIWSNLGLTYHGSLKICNSVMIVKY